MAALVLSPLKYRLSNMLVAGLCGDVSQLHVHQSSEMQYELLSEVPG